MYGELQQQGLLDRYKQALNLLLANQNSNINNSNPFDGYFGGGSNANVATPYNGGGEELYNPFVNYNYIPLQQHNPVYINQPPVQNSSMNRFLIKPTRRY